MGSGPVIRRILVPHDFGPAAESALAYATRLAAALNARVTVMHAYEDPAEGGDDAADLVRADMPYLAERIEAIARAKLADIAKRAQAAGAKIKTKIRRGRPWLEIEAEATEGRFDLIVMGTHGRRGLAHVLLGSVAEKIVRTASCPVLTVHGPAVPATRGRSSRSSTPA